MLTSSQRFTSLIWKMVTVYKFCKIETEYISLGRITVYRPIPCTWMWPIVTDRIVAWSVTLVSPAKRPNRSRCRLGCGVEWAQGTMYYMGVQISHARGNFDGKRGGPLSSIETFCRELCKNGWTDRDTIWDAKSGEPKKACIRRGSRFPMHKGNFEGKRGGPTWSIGTFYPELCKNH